jgi:hypothetical protein
MLGAVVLKGAEAEHAPRREDPAWDAAASTMAEVARATYRALVYEDERFFTFFRAATPIDVIERMAIGSRPASRRAQRGIQDLRAIPWVFAWTQTRATLPAWYGLGSGLEAAVALHGREVLVEAIQEWAFLDALIGDVEMVLAKTDLEIAERYVLLAPPDTRGVFDVLRAEFGHDLPGLFRNKTEKVDRHFGQPDKVFAAQDLVLRCDAGRAVIQVTDTQVFAAQCNEWRRTEAETFGAEHCRLDHVDTGLESAVGLQAHLVAKSIATQYLVSFRQAEFPWAARILDRGQRTRARATVVA